ncbi:alpha/beta hydrolase [Aurantimicrobium minutum]|uniref:alpha/beta hydrolase n=1 Tax=Aurantimicrobium minutum TaxID=708131 RepID=UPI0024761E6E|nr:alpha/beta hydrolase [Aurantimicrobium minutum]MDH6239909.1 acetyl esterase [Aurantimicrobium minutum]
MPVHPEIAAFLSTLPPSDATPPDVAGWRAMGEAHLPPLEERLPLFSVEDTVAGDVPIRIYTPVDAAKFGVLVYFHGGAFFSGSLETHDGIARSIADASGYKVISVGFRLAPEALFPAGLDDCYSVVTWVRDNAAYLKWDGSRLAVAGDSSGGNFAAAVTARALDDGLDIITQQVLLYPSVDLDFDTERYPSLTENAEGKGLETITLKPFNSYYINSGANPANPLVSPIKRGSLAGLPEALVVTAEYDPLRDEGEMYAQRLAQAGVKTQHIRYDGATHGFVQYFAWLPEYSSIFQEIARFLK